MLAYLDEAGDHLTTLNAFRDFENAARGPKASSTTPQEDDDDNEDDNATLRAYCRENGLRFQALVQAVKIKDQLLRALKAESAKLFGAWGEATTNAAGADTRARVLRTLAAGLAHRAAKLNEDNKSYVAVGALTRGLASKASPSPLTDSLFLHPTTALLARAQRNKPTWVVYDQVLVTTRSYMRTITAVDASWLSVVSTSLARVVEADAQHKAATKAKQAQAADVTKRRLTMVD